MVTFAAIRPFFKAAREKGNRKVTRMLSWTVFLAALVTINGCYGPTAKGRRFGAKDDYKLLGYSTKGLISRKYQTISVPIFKNRTLERRFEFELTQAVIEMIEDRTHMKVVNEPAQADTRLVCEILDFDRRILSEDTNDVVQELQIRLVLSMEWIDQKTGETIVRVKRFRETAEAVPARGENDLTAAREAFRDIAERIVERMESDW